MSLIREFGQRFQPGGRRSSSVTIVPRILVTLVLLFLGYEGMVSAFHQLNEPSDRSVYAGTALLALLSLLVPCLLWLLWRKRNDPFR